MILLGGDLIMLRLSTGFIDRNTVIITEYNNPSANKSLKYHWRYLYRGKSFPNAFIHVQKKK